MKSLPLSLDEAIVLFKMYNMVESEGLDQPEDLQIMQRIITHWPEELYRMSDDPIDDVRWAGQYIWSHTRGDLLKYVNMDDIEVVK